MSYVLAVLFVATISFAIVRAGATALELTGLSRDAARFQALSAFFGVGFTTRESELVVDNPVRRKIISHLIVVGNIGMLSTVATVIVGAGALDFNERHLESWARIGLVVLGLGGLGLVSCSRAVNRAIRWSVERMVRRARATHALDYEELLRLRAGYEVVEATLEPSHPAVNAPLHESRPRGTGVTVLGLTRAGGEFIGAPTADTLLSAGDTLVVYGRRDAIDAFFEARDAPPARPQPSRAPAVHSAP